MQVFQVSPVGGRVRVDHYFIKVHDEVREAMGASLPESLESGGGASG
jgi:hypothetical protein